MPKTSSTVEGISRCPRLYRLCVATQVTCEALGTCAQFHRIVTGKEDARATLNLPTGSTIPGSRRHRTAPGEGQEGREGDESNKRNTRRNSLVVFCASLNMCSIMEVSHGILIIKSYLREETNILDIMGVGGQWHKASKISSSISACGMNLLIQNRK
nr:uncharacterized protein LOC110572647 isoform X1 [Neomonachus schauinslandi]